MRLVKDNFYLFDAMMPANAPSTHTAQLFDDAKSRSDALVGFVRQGLEDGDSVVVVAIREHWQQAATPLLRRGLQLDADIASYRLRVYDANEMLGRFTIENRVDRMLFDQVVGERVRRLRSRARRLRIYGEMVDLLAGSGDFANALRLEEMWNDLLREELADLFCGYSSIHFGDPRHSASLSQICRTHSCLRSSPHDKLGSHLLQPHIGSIDAPQRPPQPDAGTVHEA